MRLLPALLFLFSSWYCVAQSAQEPSSIANSSRDSNDNTVVFGKRLSIGIGFGNIGKMVFANGLGNFKGLLVYDVNLRQEFTPIFACQLEYFSHKGTQISSIDGTTFGEEFNEAETFKLKGLLQIGQSKYSNQFLELGCVGFYTSAKRNNRLESTDLLGGKLIWSEQKSKEYFGFGVSLGYNINIKGMMLKMEGEVGSFVFNDESDLIFRGEPPLDVAFIFPLYFKIDVEFYIPLYKFKKTKKATN